jgi:hypothetical protein
MGSSSERPGDGFVDSEPDADEHTEGHLVVRPGSGSDGHVLWHGPEND